MEIRALQGDEIREAAELAAVVFGCDQDSWTPGWYRTEELGGPGAIWGAFDGGRMVSSCVASAQRVFAGGRSIPGGFVGGVATVPEARRQGHAAAMLRAALHHCRERGILISYLWPFSYRYYRKLGWELAADGILTSLSSDQVQQLEPAGEARDLRFRDLDEAVEFWTAHARAYNGMGARSREWWVRFVADRGPDEAGPDEEVFAGEHKATGLWMGGELSALMLWHTQEDEDGKRSITATDFFYNTARSAAGSLAAVFARAPECTRISFGSPPHVALHTRWDEPRDPVRTVRCGPMARVTDVRGYLEATGWREDARGKLRLTVSDPVFDNFTGTFEIGGGRAVSAQSGGSELRCTVQTFVQVAAGYLTPLQAVVMGRIDSSDIEGAELLSAASGSCIPWRSAREPG